MFQAEAVTSSTNLVLRVWVKPGSSAAALTQLLRFNPTETNRGPAPRCLVKRLVRHQPRNPFRWNVVIETRKQCEGDHRDSSSRGNRKNQRDPCPHAAYSALREWGIARLIFIKYDEFRNGRLNQIHAQAEKNIPTERTGWVSLSWDCRTYKVWAKSLAKSIPVPTDSTTSSRPKELQELK